MVFTTSVANLYRSKVERPLSVSATIGVTFLFVVFVAVVRETVALVLGLFDEGKKRPFRREWVVEVQDSVDVSACRMASNGGAVGAAESLKGVVAIIVGIDAVTQVNDWKECALQISCRDVCMGLCAVRGRKIRRLTKVIPICGYQENKMCNKVYLRQPDLVCVFSYGHLAF